MTPRLGIVHCVPMPETNDRCDFVASVPCADIADLTTTRSRALVSANLRKDLITDLIVSHAMITKPTNYGHRLEVELNRHKDRLAPIVVEESPFVTNGGISTA